LVPSDAMTSVELMGLSIRNRRLDDVSPSDATATSAATATLATITTTHHTTDNFYAHDSLHESQSPPCSPAMALVAAAAVGGRHHHDNGDAHQRLWKLEHERSSAHRGPDTFRDDE
jgi:hypothetical protein